MRLQQWMVSRPQASIEERNNKMSPNLLGIKGCIVSSRYVIATMWISAFLTGFSIHHTHHWIVHSVPLYANGIGFSEWLNFAISLLCLFLCLEFFKSSTCKSDRQFFGLLISFSLIALVRQLAIFQPVRSAMLSMDQLHPQILYSLGILRWVIGIAMYIVVIDHWIRSRKSHAIAAQA
jgi:hypothetical protein